MCSGEYSGIIMKWHSLQQAVLILRGGTPVNKAEILLVLFGLALSSCGEAIVDCFVAWRIWETSTQMDHKATRLVTQIVSNSQQERFELIWTDLNCKLNVRSEYFARSLIEPQQSKSVTIIVTKYVRKTINTTRSVGPPFQTWFLRSAYPPTGSTQL